MKRFFAHLLTGCAVLAAFSTPVAASSLTPETQTAILAKAAAEGQYAKHWNWLHEPSGKLRDDVVFAVTDFDRDGKLELFGLKPRREKEEPRIIFQELLDEAGQFGSGRFMAGHSYLPDLLTGEAFGQAEARFDEGTDRYRYIMEESTLLAEDGDFRKTKTTFFSLGVLGSELLVEELWSILQEGDRADSAARYYLPAWLGVEAESDQPVGAPEEVDLDRILAYKEERVPGYDAAMVSFGWRTGAALEKAREEGRLAEELLNSYRVFEASWDI
ncbi:MAG: hypothetical protein ACTTH3_01010 [Schwartzia sp. (in: firmicutes)]